MNLAGKKVTVMGLGLHGGARGTISWLVDQGAVITVTDMKTVEELAPSLEALKKFSDITYVLGEHREEDFTTADLVIRNPAVPADSSYLLAARKADVPVEMDSSLFFMACPTKDIIGVTGSKGKTTACKAITTVLRANGDHVVEVGTDGASPLGALSHITEKTVVVFELSSWRLEALAPHVISPPVAVVTSILPDHLNTYDSMDEYEGVKKNIIRWQKKDDTAYLNHDDERLRRWESDATGNITWFSFSDFETIADVEATDIPLIGNHQKTNVLPAIHIGLQRNISIGVIKEALAGMSPVPHRLEIVRNIDDVQYINNSAATIPEATVEAIRALPNTPLVLILGGGNKQLDFEKLAECVADSNVRHIIWLPGTATKEMRAAIATKTDVPTDEVTSMQEAVLRAHTIAQSHDTVLLSPAATSFGLFVHEFDRGDQFREAVLALN